MLNLAIHHIGIATKSIDKEFSYFKNLGFIVEDSFIDTTQGIRGSFIVPRESNLPVYRFELLEHIHDRGILDSYLKNNTKMYHIAFLTKSIESSLKELFLLYERDESNNKPPYNKHYPQKPLLQPAKQIITGGGGGSMHINNIQLDKNILLPQDTPLDNKSSTKAHNTNNNMLRHKSKPRIIIPIMNSSYFAKLCFVMLPNRLLVEFVELKHGI